MHLPPLGPEGGLASRGTVLAPSVASGRLRLCHAADDTLWCFGESTEGALGPGVWKSALPVQVGTGGWRSVTAGYYHTCGVRTDDTLWCWGSNEHGTLGNDHAWAQTPVPVALP
jgi:alpha-tubulin suppressor-like RCC1 family protein